MLFLLYALWIVSVYGFYSPSDGILAVTTSNFAKQVEQAKLPVLLEFYSPHCGHCQLLVPEYKLAASKLKGLAIVATVDCTQDPLCNRFNVQGVPSIKVFVPNQNVPLDYNGPRTAAGLVDFIVPHIPSKVQRLSDSTMFEKFLKDESAKAILFSAKSQIPYLLKALSTTFDTIQFGEVKKSQTDLVNRYNVTQFPSLLFWEKGAIMPKRYEGPMKHAGLSQFFRLQSSNLHPFNKIEGSLLVEIKNQSQFNKHCDKSLCILSFLDESMEKKVIESVAATFMDHNMVFGWVNANKAKKLMKDADVSEILPGMIALNTPRGWYRLFRGAFDQEGITEFITEITKGKGRNFKLTFQPVLSELKDEL